MRIAQIYIDYNDDAKSGGKLGKCIGVKSRK